MSKFFKFFVAIYVLLTYSLTMAILNMGKCWESSQPVLGSFKELFYVSKASILVSLTTKFFHNTVEESFEESWNHRKYKIRQEKNLQNNVHMSHLVKNQQNDCMPSKDTDQPGHLSLCWAICHSVSFVMMRLLSGRWSVFTVHIATELHSQPIIYVPAFLPNYLPWQFKFKFNLWHRELTLSYWSFVKVIRDRFPPGFKNFQLCLINVLH